MTRYFRRSTFVILGLGLLTGFLLFQIKGGHADRKQDEENGKVVHQVHPLELGKKIKSLALRLSGKMAMAHGSRADRMKSIKNSHEYTSFLSLVEDLNDLRLSDLVTTKEKIAFWTNVYNALVFHSVLDRNIVGSVLDVPGFFDKDPYEVGGHAFTLDEIEHGILRSNRPKSSGQAPIIDSKDKRLIHGLDKSEFDPRVHFVLHCGSRSCPPFQFLDADHLEAQLETATQGFIRAECEVKEGKILLPKIFEWYAIDFEPDLRQFLLPYSSGELKRALQSRAPIVYKEYDWSLSF